jgi:sensor domain DACNV-containing protein
VPSSTWPIFAAFYNVARMLQGQGYPAAHTLAPIVHAHFARHLDDARGRLHDRVASLPDVAAIAAIIETGFWTSLRREEGYVPRVSLAFVAPDEADEPLRFAQPLPLDAAALTRVSPAVAPAGIHLAVARGPDGLSVWGTIRTLPTLCFVLEVSAPGLLVVKHQRGGVLGKFVNVAVVEGDEIKVIDESASTLPDCPPLLTSLLGFDSPSSWVETVNVLVQLAVAMRAHGRGGSLLVVPSTGEQWRESIVQPISYAITPPFMELARLARERPDASRQKMWRESLDDAVGAIASLTAVDGATILNADYDLLAFGAKIGRRKGSPQVEQVTVTEPIEGGVASVVSPGYLGGTRHLSASQFVHDQRDTLALVASQDGRFTVFAWSPCEGMVHAHRVETLLL